MNKPWLRLLIAAFAISACEGAAEPTSSLPPPSAVAPTLPPATATDLAPADGVIQLDQGCQPGIARCEDLPAGTYETSGTWALLRGLTLTLPAGWSSAEQDAGEFQLHQATDQAQVSEIYFWVDVVAWVDGKARPELGTTADEFADYLLGDSRLIVSEGPNRTFGVRRPDF